MGERDETRHEWASGGGEKREFGAGKGNLIKSARCLAEISLMKTFVRRASGAELSADLTEKETNERTNERRVYVSLFPSTRQFYYRVCDYAPQESKRGREREFGTLVEI